MSESDLASNPDLTLDESEPEPRPDPTLPGGLAIFFVTLAVLAVLRILLGYITFPESILLGVNVLVTAVFIGAPIVALFYAANSNWKKTTAVWFIVGGLIAHLGLYFLDKQLTGAKGPLSGVLGAISQAGLSTWCIGLGALLTTMIRDKNLLIPISIFLAAYDAFLVLTPVGFTQVILQKLPNALPTVAMQVPEAIANTAAQPPGGKAEIGGYVGPADLVFMGMFFVALFRFRMKTRLTLTVMIPVLIGYMALVGLTGMPLPALIPIGLVILIVNWGEIRLTKEEWISTIVLTVLCGGLLAWAATRPKPKPPIEILPGAPGQEAEAPEGSPGSALSSQPPSGPPTAPGNTPDRR